MRIFLFIFLLTWQTTYLVAEDISVNDTMVIDEPPGGQTLQEKQDMSSLTENILKEGLYNDQIGLLPYEKKAFETGLRISEQLKKDKNFFLKVKENSKKLASTIKQNVEYTAHSIHQKTQAFKDKLYKKLPVNRLIKDGSLVTAMGVKGCAIGILAGTPLDVALAVQTAGMGPAVISTLTCAMGATIAAVPYLCKACFQGGQDLYKAHKIRKEIHINQADLDLLKNLLVKTTGADTENMTTYERQIHLEKILELNRQVTSIEVYIKQLEDNISEMRGESL